MNLADAVLVLAPIEARLAQPLGFLPADHPRAAAAGSPLRTADGDAMRRLFAAAGLRSPRTVSDPDDLSVYDKIAADALATAAVEPSDLEAPEASMALARARSEGEAAPGAAERRRIVRSGDGVLLSALRVGQPAGTPFLVFGAPGTPAGLISGWLRGLGRHRPVLTWETRGLFGPHGEVVSSLGIAAQLLDACAVLDDGGWSEVHVLGLCGGAALALAFASAHPARVRSLSLWFGDYELGDLALKTDHQRNLQALMQMVVAGRTSAGSLHTALIRTMTRLTEPDLAPLALYPYANPRLLGQYCHMNYPIMSTNCAQYLERIRAPGLVVFSPDDVTTHPDGSRAVARRLGAKLEEIATSGHLHAFRGHAADVHRALSFHLAAE